MAAALPTNSKPEIAITDAFLNQLWGDLLHPPTSYLGEQFRYRQADGSYNNIQWPHIGRANMPYARSVRPTIMQPIQPDPGLLFDTLMARTSYEEHPAKISSMLFYLGSVIIHDLFRTDHTNYNNSLTSSYLDLSPLYGSNQAEQNTMRLFSDGKLKPDCFSEKRVLGFPPGVGVLLIMFNRFHNYVVEQLAAINEADRFKKPHQDIPKKQSEACTAKYDEDLFQTARLITCGLYINCILKDYVRTILALNRTNNVWDLDPRSQEGKTVLGKGASQGTGNQVSAEFNLLYRWHAAVSQKDELWTEQEYNKLFPDKDPATLTELELLQGLAQWEAALPEDPLKRPFADLVRDKNGSLNDDQLVSIVTSSIEDCAGAFQANNVPTILRGVEILGIKQARSWKLATLNEFRKFFNLTTHETFEDINPDPKIANQLKHLYDHPDLVELYPGLVVEKSKELVEPGSGLCTNFTISRAILSDAVALVRGDRLYTVDYTPQNLTNWGYNQANYDISVDEGQVFYKLFYRAFPQHFKYNSIYAHYPLVIPSENRAVFQRLGKADKYTWDRPARIPDMTVITSYAASKSILYDQLNYKVTWGEAIEFLMYREGHRYGTDFALSGDRSANKQSRNIIIEALHPRDWHAEVKTFYEDMTLKLLHQKSCKLAGANQVDIVRDVGNLANTHFAANVFLLPLKTDDNPRGIYAEAELYGIMALIFITIFFDADPMQSFALRRATRKMSQQLGELVLPNVEAINASGVLANIIGFFHRRTALSEYGVHMVQRLLASGKSPKEVVWTHLLPTAGGMVANQAQLFAQTLDYYLSDEGAVHLPDINRLAKMNTPEADEKILR